MAKQYNRREILKMGTAAVAGTTMLGLPLMAQASQTASPQADRLRHKRGGKCLVIGAHPDDPETCCGGTMARLAREGWDVVAVYLTRGEAGIEGKSHEQASAIRSQEAINACRVLDCRHAFLGQTDGNTVCDADHYKQMRKYIASENPDVVFTHWPIDSHRDHAICGLLVLDSWRRLEHAFELYYMEAMTGTQTQMFVPDTYVDISDVIQVKHEACMCHVSQGMDDINHWHYRMEQFRGIECRCEVAEAFLHHRWDSKVFL